MTTIALFVAILAIATCGFMVVYTVKAIGQRKVKYALIRLIVALESQ